jgi:nuclear protein NHN1
LCLQSAGKAPSSTQSSSSRQPPHSPPKQAEASSSSSCSAKDPEAIQKKRWKRPDEPEISQRHTSPKEDVTSSQTASKPIKRAADSVLTPRHVETQSNKRNVDETTSSKRVEDSASSKRMEARPLKRSADSAAPNPKRILPENIPIKQPSLTRETLETPDSKAAHASNTSRREELLRELKAVEDAIARKRARIE